MNEQTEQEQRKARLTWWIGVGFLVGKIVYKILLIATMIAIIVIALKL